MGFELLNNKLRKMETSDWKRIQQRTFTRYVNHHLKDKGLKIEDLQTDLSDGLKLIALVEKLSGKNIQRFNKTPIFRTQKLENVSIALNHMENEGVTLVNIDKGDTFIFHMIQSNTNILQFLSSENWCLVESLNVFP